MVTPGGVVTTVAGLAGSSGSDDGTGSAARFNLPYGIAVDGSGNLYVADTYNGTIRQVAPGGVVTTIAGLAGSYGSADGTGSAARFYVPYGVAVDGSGNIYVSDTGNNTIRQVTPLGVVTTIAGAAGYLDYGSADGAGTAARFSLPWGLAANASGNLYVGDSANNTIRGVTAGGVVTTVAGLAGIGSLDGAGSAARFYQPGGVAVDGSGNIYVADTYNDTIRKVSSFGQVTTIAGLARYAGGQDGTGGTARFSHPSSVAVDGSGNAYVADSENNTIRQVTPLGAVTTIAGLRQSFGSADGTNSAARFYEPSGVAVDGSNNVYVADKYNHTLRRVAPGGVVTTVAGLAGSPGSADGAGSVARFNLPSGVAVDGSGNIYVADTGNHTIRKVTFGGVVTTFAGLAAVFGSADGTGSAVRFYHPSGVAVDNWGNVYVADSGNFSIRKVTPAGIVTTVAGSTGNYGTADGTGSAARFFEPLGVAVDGSGNIYVADYYNNDIRFGISAPPKLSIVANGPNSVSVLWPNTPTWVLQQTSDLGSGSWTASSFSISTVNSTNSITVTTAAGNQFFRLIGQ